MESSTYSHKEETQFDFPNAWVALHQEVKFRRLQSCISPLVSSRLIQLANPRPRPAKLLLLGAFAAVYLIWGSTYVAIRFALVGLPPLLMAGSRYVLAGAILYCFARWRGAPRPTLPGWRNALVSSLGLIALGNGGVTLGEQYLSTSLTALLLATIPLFLVIISWLIGRTTRPAFSVLLGLAMGMAGICLLAQVAKPDHLAQPGHRALGIGLVLLAAGCSALGALYTSKQPPSPSPWLASSMQMWSGGLLLLVSGLGRGEIKQVQLTAVTAESWVAFIYLVLFGSLLAFTAYAWLLQVVEPTVAGTYAFVNPVVALGLGWICLGEQLTPLLCSSAALTLIGVILMMRKPRPSAGLDLSFKRSD